MPANKSVTTPNKKPATHRKAVKMINTTNEFKATVKEFVNKLTTIENEMTILRQDRSELFTEMKSKLDPRSFRAAVKIHNLQKSTPDQTSLSRILEVLETAE